MMQVQIAKGLSDNWAPVRLGSFVHAVTLTC